jgi:transcription-repair coupling factor (superfamily II helicase)
LLAPGRVRLADVLEAGALRAGPAMHAYAAALLAERAAPLLVVVPTERDAEALVDGLAAFLGSEAVADFPPWETLPHERLSPQAATVGRRLRVLDRLRARSMGEDDTLIAIVAPVRALLQPMDPRLAEREPVRLHGAYDGGFDGLVTSLAGLGYTRTTLVEHRGEFAVRGGIVDVFPSAADHPVRVEFWGDDVDSLREFAAADQRTLAALDTVVIDAARELVLDEETADTARLLRGRLPALSEQLQHLADGVAFEGMEALVTAIHPAPAYLPDFFPDGSGMVVVDPPRVADRARELREQAAALLVAGWGVAGDRGDPLLGDLDADAVGFAEWDAVRKRGTGPEWTLSALTGPDAAAELPGLPWDSFRGDISGAAAQARLLAADGVVVVLTTAGHGPALRLAEVLREEGLATAVGGGLDHLGSGGRVAIVESPLREGFWAPELGIAVLGEWDLFGPRRSRASRRLPSKRAASETVVDLAPGDYVVHSIHGVGRYAGIVTRKLLGPTNTVGGGNAGVVTRDYVVLEYADGDRLFVPSDQVDAVAKYVGGEQPRVMRMGGGDWERAKGKVRKAVQEMAAELIRLYQARMHASGHGFSPDTAWQRELETAFPYAETPDQLEAIGQVKQDMEAPLPMDRLICGDVGFGKTEIAVRAAAKAVFDGKQAAVLVPTTLLAQQHGETFAERFAGFPVAVAVLSRFASPREQRQILDGLAAGTVDLVIGTHRLLGADVTFHDLGLVVVDEEQRFGVAHKERLKQLRTEVDVLTMTATPIPRTMEMAITGIRDLSTIETPPEERQPVVTQVGVWDEALAALAVRRELLRDGQVFWVHNQVQTIAAAAQRVRELVAGVRVGIAHGQMAEAELEEVMVRFWQREFDVLVCTTIIEAGLDVPNANTLIIERADLLGLAQLYQLRGRVGRSSERGYAYLFYPEHASVTEDAYKRLETVAAHSGLGSGLSIALRDLEIRGAGNVLSSDQSGHVAAVGFDAYARLMREAVEALHDGGGPGRAAEREAEIKIDLPVDAHLPRSYIGDEALRLEAYRKIAAVRNAAGLRAIREELRDRYGSLPGPAERLLAVAALRAGAGSARSPRPRGGPCGSAPSRSRTSRRCACAVSTPGRYTTSPPPPWSSRCRPSPTWSAGWRASSRACSPPPPQPADLHCRERPRRTGRSASGHSRAFSGARGARRGHRGRAARRLRRRHRRPIDRGHRRRRVDPAGRGRAALRGGGEEPAVRRPARGRCHRRPAPPAPEPDPGPAHPLAAAGQRRRGGARHHRRRRRHRAEARRDRRAAGGRGRLQRGRSAEQHVRGPGPHPAGRPRRRRPGRAAAEPGARHPRGGRPPGLRGALRGEPDRAPHPRAHRTGGPGGAVPPGGRRGFRGPRR